MFVPKLEMLLLCSHTQPRRPSHTILLISIGLHTMSLAARCKDRSGKDPHETACSIAHIGTTMSHQSSQLLFRLQTWYSLRRWALSEAHRTAPRPHRWNVRSVQDPGAVIEMKFVPLAESEKSSGCDEKLLRVDGCFSIRLVEFKSSSCITSLGPNPLTPQDMAQT